MLTIILFSIAVGLCVHFIWERKRRMNLFKEIGIPGPQPNLFLGNQMDLTEGVSVAIAEWQKQFGDTFGYFEGSEAVLVTKDFEIIKQVFIKDFSKFTARKRFPIGPNPKTSKNVSVLTAEGKRWKRIRTLLSPTFSTGKLKQTTPLVMLGVNNLMEVLKEKVEEGKSFNIMPLFQAMTLDVVSSTAFGLDIDAQRNQDGPMIRSCRQIFAQQNMYNMHPVRKMVLYLSLIFPPLKEILFNIWNQLNKMKVLKNDAYWLGDAVRNVIKERKAGKSDRRDFLQMLIDAESMEGDLDATSLTMTAEGGTNGQEPNESEIKMNPESPQKRKIHKKITAEELVSNSISFLLAGYETTSTALSYAAYELALQPIVQRKVQEEIDKVVGQDLPSPSHLSHMPYLDMVFNEVLRKNTVVPTFITRRCEQEVQIGDMIIPEGLNIQVNARAIHADPDLWGPTDPEIFDPERFSQENKAARNPLAFQAFGTGPRNCIGMRLALMEGKLALISILQKYTISKCEDTEVPLTTIDTLTSVPKYGVHVTISERLTDNLS